MDTEDMAKVFLKLLFPTQLNIGTCCFTAPSLLVVISVLFNFPSIQFTNRHGHGKRLCRGDRLCRGNRVDRGDSAAIPFLPFARYYMSIIIQQR